MQIMKTPVFEIELNLDVYAPTIEWRSTSNGGVTWSNVVFDFSRQEVKHANDYNLIISEILDCNYEDALEELESDAFQMFGMRPVDRFFQLQADVDLNALSNLRLFYPGLCDSCQSVYPAEWHDKYYRDTELEFPMCGGCGHYQKHLPGSNFAWVWYNEKPKIQDGREKNDQTVKVYNRLNFAEICLQKWYDSEEDVGDVGDLSINRFGAELIDKPVPFENVDIGVFQLPDGSIITNSDSDEQTYSSLNQMLNDWNLDSV